VSTLSHSNGVLSGTGTLTVSGAASISGNATHAGSGKTVLRGTTTVGVAGQASFANALALNAGRRRQKWRRKPVASDRYALSRSI
jgi:hypothetical protein